LHLLAWLIARVSCIKTASERAFEERRGDEQCADAEDEKEKQVELNCGETAVL
jgi:hypothetical protein